MADEDVLKILLDNDYVCFVKRVDRNSFFFSIPKSQHNRHMAITYVVAAVRGDSSSKKVERGSPIVGKTTEHIVPNYALRVWVTADIHRICKILGYDPDLVLYYNESDVVVGRGQLGLIETELMQPPRTKELKEKEFALLRLFEQVKTGGNLDTITNSSIELGIFDGYRAVREMYED